MIEVIERGGAWLWVMISDAGRPLIWSEDRYPSDLAAAEAARAYRSAFWRVAADVDHRQARAI